MYFPKIVGIIQLAANETRKQHQGEQSKSHKAEVKRRAANANKPTSVENYQEQHHE